MQKKYFWVLILFYLSITYCNAQSYVLGDKIITGKVGLFPTFYGSEHWKTIIPTISVDLDYAIKDSIGPGIIGIGGFFGYGKSRTEYHFTSANSYGSNYNYVILGVLGNYHYYNKNKLDLYGGLMAGAYIISVKNYGNKETLNEDMGELAWSVHAGGRYYFRKQLSAFCEIGFGLNVLSIGLSYRL